MPGGLPPALPTSLPPNPLAPGGTVPGPSPFNHSALQNLPTSPVTSGLASGGTGTPPRGMTPPRGVTPPQGVTPPRGMTPPYTTAATPAQTGASGVAPPPVGGFVPTAGVVQATHKVFFNYSADKIIVKLTQDDQVKDICSQ